MLIKSKAVDTATASHLSGASHTEGVRGGGVFKITCRDADGNLKWEAESHNLVVNVGLKDMNEKYFTGSAYTAAWYIGLYGAAASNNPAAGDTAASHTGWTEVTTYSQATRPAATFGTSTTADPSVISNSGSPASFSINGTTTVYTSTGEVPAGSGYSTGGVTLTNVQVLLSGTTAYVVFDNPTWAGASFVCRGALIYNASKADRAIAVLDFGADKTASGTFTLQLPAATAASALLRFA